MASAVCSSSTRSTPARSAIDAYSPLSSHPCQIGDGACDPPDTVGATGSEHTDPDCSGDELGRSFRLLAVRHLEMAIDLATLRLGSTRPVDTIGDRLTRFAFRPRVLRGLHPGDADDQVEAVEQGAGDA